MANNYFTFDRFQGAWLGGIIASYIRNCVEKETEIINVNSPLPSWIVDREKIARIILENREKAVMVARITPLLPATSPCRIVSLLLPLFLSDCCDRNTYKKIVTENKFELINTTEIQEDILIWSYLIILALTDRFKFEESDIDTAIEQLLSGVKLETTSWGKKLKQIVRVENNSSTLQQLTEQLRQQENLEINTQLNASLAIALSLFCFAATPRNFMLSVKRASQIDSPLSSEIAILTGTISGAYNGMRGVPNNWLFLLSRDRRWRQIQNTAQKLFETWLGAYNPMNNNSFVCDPEFEAIAMPNIIQARQNLQIISQKSDLS